jgi:RHS repeat-associated protein
MLGNSGLIHMNGRVMDATIGRFISADPYVSEPGNTQNFNRYSYVYNNPLSFIDPSGFLTTLPPVSCPAGGCDRGIRPGIRLMPGDVRPAGGTHDSSKEPPSVDTLDEVVVAARQIIKRLKKWACNAGNSVATGSDMLGNVSGKLALTGLGVTAAGALAGQPEFGLGIMAVGGTGSVVAGVMQFGAGLLQGAGGGGFGNSGYAALSVGTGLILSRGIIGPASSGYRTVSQRAADSFSNGTATVAGGVNDFWSQFVDAAAPQQVNCPGGH